MKNIRKIILLLMSLTFLSILMLWVVNSGVLGCLAYYEQCSANRVEGLSQEECSKRDDSVAFLLEEQVCLVKPVER
ncbi:hypothetical protein GCM10009123_21110 [Kangiella japonica]|uniref:Uncharacterized protein n=1 Tax=Kangiella japonica TaxID=647384 RepID=A0ABP3CRM1_9GAMM